MSQEIDGMDHNQCMEALGLSQQAEHAHLWWSIDATGGPTGDEQSTKSVDCVEMKALTGKVLFGTQDAAANVI